MVDSLPRRQSRPFRPAPVALTEDGPRITPPSTDLMEHLEDLFLTTSHVELAQLIASGTNPAEHALHRLAEMAGREQVLGYMRMLIERAREVGHPG